MTLLRLAASVAHFSTHPLARAIVAEAANNVSRINQRTDFLNVPGLGMEASIDGSRIFVGSRRLMRDRGIALPAVELTIDAEVWIANDQALGVIYLRDEIRPADQTRHRFPQALRSIGHTAYGRSTRAGCDGGGASRH